MGYDSDHALARGEVGRVGVAISCLADMETLLAELPLDRVTTSMTINATAPLLLAFYVAVADARGIPRGALGGTVQNDVLKEYIARGTYIYPPAASLRLITDVFEFTAAEVPQWNSISVSGYHMREAGATAVQELAFTLADGLTYLEAARARGLDVVRIARRMSFFFNAHNHLFEEVAKFRAARTLWATLLRERFGDPRPRGAQAALPHPDRRLDAHRAAAAEQRRARRRCRRCPRCSAARSRCTRTASTRRSACRASASALLALRTQQVIAHESGVTDTVDPLAGSYFVEALTADLERQARALIEHVDRMGGMLEAIAEGWVQEQIHLAAYRWQREVESGERVVVGVNRFADEPAPRRSAVPPDPRRGARARRVPRRLAGRSASRPRTPRRSRGWSGDARGSANLVPPILAALQARATLGEVCDALRGVFGVHQPGPSR